MTECEIAQCFVDKIVTGRKPHICCECGCRIEKGERHGVSSGVWSYGPARYRQHMLCREACIAIRDDLTGGECIGFGTLMDEWGEQFRCVERGHRVRTMIAGIKRRMRAEQRGASE